jgi:hypothetical protein
MRGGKGAVDAKFWKHIKEMIKVVIPKSWCTEVKIIITLTILLLCRTMMSIWLADVNGRVV